MPLVFAALTPHPPLLIPEVGKESNKKVQKTVNSMENLSDLIEQAEPDTIIIMSPHSLVYPKAFNVNCMPRLHGSFSAFKAPNISFTFNNDLEIAEKIVNAADAEKIPVIPYNNEDKSFELDHGTLVPLYFLSRGLGQDVSVLPLAYSFASPSEHYIFGQLISEVINKSNKRIAFIASGDLSHRLLENPPVSTVAEDFDELVKTSLENKDNLELLAVTYENRQVAGECAYNSIVTLLGVLQEKEYKPEILSYEDPFGVGYLVANFQLTD